MLTSITNYYYINSVKNNHKKQYNKDIYKNKTLKLLNINIKQYL